MSSPNAEKVGKPRRQSAAKSQPNSKRVKTIPTGLLYIAVDIGGTNSRLQLFELESDGIGETLRLDKRYSSRNFRGLEQLLRKFLKDAGGFLSGDIDTPCPTVHACCVAICGPVDHESVQSGPSLPEQGPTGWGTDTNVVTKALKGAIKQICLVNDFVAVGYGLTAVSESQLMQVHPGKRDPVGVMVAAGAGTGLGQVFLTWEQDQHVAQASEGGMAEFHARSEKEWGFRQYLMQRDGHATVEGLVSGPGIVNAYKYLWAQRCNEHQTGGASDALEGIAEKEQSQHASRIVAKALQADSDQANSGASEASSVCSSAEQDAVEMFVVALAGTAVPTRASTVSASYCCYVYHRSSKGSCRALHALERTIHHRGDRSEAACPNPQAAEQVM
jgi:glucokinase